MRNELENIELIEKYLRDELSADERASFEEQLKTDANLQKEVELQKDVVKGIERLAMKQTIQKSYKSYKLGKSGLNIGLGAIVLVGVVSVFLWMNNNTSLFNNDANVLPKLNEQGENLWADADKYLPSQLYVINTSADTVIETSGGIVMYIPQGSFLDSNGNVIKGEVEFEVKEALNAEQILQGGLSSMSGNKLLESAGMFYVNARKDGKTVQFNPDKGIYTEVPTDVVKPNMQLFEGKRMTDGSIDWLNPTSLDKFLTPFDINTLNFYPPKFESKLAELGGDVSDKKYKDSLYYSFAWKEKGANSTYLLADNNGTRIIPEMPKGSTWFQSDTMDITTALANGYQIAYIETVKEIVKGINPAKIKAIWNNEFNNTLLSTREFEERLPSIFGTCNDKVLDLYIKNINLDMYVIDSMAANITSGLSRDEFLSFASRKDGKVQIDDHRVKKLQEHYEQKQKMIAEAIEKTQRKFDKENASLDEDAEKTRSNFSKDEFERKQDNYVKEFNLNLTDAYRQLGKPKPERLDAAGIYRLTLKRGGWKNVDAYVMESLDNRETLNYTDQTSGKKAVIKYEAITISIKDEEKFDRLFVYVLPDKLNSFMRLKKEGNKYTEKLNELMNHNLVCLGYVGEQAYFYSLDGVVPKEYLEIELLPMSQSELKHNLNKYDKTQSKSLLKDFDYQLFEVKDSIRQNKMLGRRKFRDEIKKVIFPCGFMPSVASTITEGVTNINTKWVE